MELVRAGDGPKTWEIVTFTHLPLAAYIKHNKKKRKLSPTDFSLRSLRFHISGQCPFFHTLIIVQLGLPCPAMSFFFFFSLPMIPGQRW
ncbi:hypothetical protein I7I48_01669 [Histoplasma ohiense]|nr:hypothetical protein I7I48_01669 [Histoplasma ohiense (nom. inval.)]